MKVKTFFSLIRAYQLPLLLRFKKLFAGFYRLGFLASMADSPFMEKLAHGPVPIETLTGDFPDKTEMLHQLSDTGFKAVSARELIPGNKYYAFIGHRLA